MTWTRTHDAWLARECEGLEVDHQRHGLDWICYPAGEEWKWRCVTAYNLDPAASIRAAEAWRKKVTGRSYIIHSPLDTDTQCSVASAACYEPDNTRAGYANDNAALAWALYRATGGPA